MESARFDLENPLEQAERLMSDGRAAEAAEMLEGLLAQGRGGLLARLACERALMQAGKPQQAVEMARETAALHPNLAEAALGLGEVLLACEQLPTAIAEFQRALRLDPDCSEARLLLGCAWLQAGEAERALDSFSRLDPATPGLSEEVARAEAMREQVRCDAGYVRHLFDQFSSDYDTRMVSHLSYRGPQILRELAGLVLPEASGLAVLDLGCGTGLSGEVFKDRAARLVGIDLSPAMVDKAREKNIYDVLSVGDIEAGLGVRSYDLVIAADTLVYLGDLDAVMRSVAAALNPGGRFLFTVEAKDGEGFELGPKRRWRHSEAYLRGLAQSQGFDVAGLMHCVPRMEAHAAVNGFAVALRKRA
jgi:predicted TPR repeat methyltransferase